MTKAIMSLSAASRIQRRCARLTEPNPAESVSCEDTTLFADPDPEIFIATIPFPEPNAHPRSLNVRR
jgi:hypothetical protein